MRLLLVIEEETLGGAELSFLELSRSLARRADVHLALGRTALQTHPSDYTGLSDCGVSLHVCTNPLYPGTLANLHRQLRRRAAGELAGMIESIGPVAIVVNLPTVERGQTIVDAARLVSPTLPVWGLLHLVQRPSTIGARLGHVRDLMVKSLLSRFDRLVTVSDAGAGQLSNRYAVPRPAVLHPPTLALQPVRSAGERARRRTEAGLPHGLLVGMVGRVQLRQKGHDAALRVLAQLLHRGLSVNLVVMGDGPDLPAVRRLAENMGLAPRVNFLGWRTDAGELIPLLDAVLLPSHFEGMPQTALQAASAQVPVVAYAVDGLTELLPPGFQIVHGDEPGLVTALREVLEGTRVWPSRQLAERAAEWGDPERSAERLLTLLRGGAA